MESEARIGGEELALAGAMPAKTSASNRRLFVVGSARSGTTAVFEALNSRVGIRMFPEMNAALYEIFPDLERDFGRHWGTCYRRRLSELHGDNCDYAKDYGLPPFEEFSTCRDLLDTLGSRVSYTGEKIAIFWPQEWVDASLYYQSKYYQSSHYVITLRNPYDVFSSAKILLNSDSDTFIFERIKTAFEASLRYIKAFPQHRVVFYEFLNDGVNDELAEWLQVGHPDWGSYKLSPRARAPEAPEVEISRQVDRGLRLLSWAYEGLLDGTANQGGACRHLDPALVDEVISNLEKIAVRI